MVPSIGHGLESGSQHPVPMTPVGLRRISGRRPTPWLSLLPTVLHGPPRPEALCRSRTRPGPLQGRSLRTRVGDVWAHPPRSRRGCCHGAQEAKAETSALAVRVVKQI